MLFGDGLTCHIEGIGIVRIKLFDVMVRELQDDRSLILHIHYHILMLIIK